MENKMNENKFLHMLLPTYVVASIYPPPYLDTMMHNNCIYDK